MSDRSGTAQWEAQPVVAERYPFAQGKFWLGRADDETAIGYSDDRHICLVSGTRGGKGTSLIINNLCFWPGSAIVVDPKGENATVTAARRGQGSEHCAGLGQAVHVLDPFKTTQVDECYRSCFNPLTDLDPQADETIDEASRLANAIVVVKDDSPEPMWDESARTMVRGLILHVLTAPGFTADERNLVMVRSLISRGQWKIADALRDMGHGDTMDPSHLLLWKSMELNPAFNGIIAGIGSEFRSMMTSSPKTYLGIFRAASQHTEFLDSPGMARVLAKSDFKLSELKTRPEGMTLYLSLPQRYMDTHYRWLRMMVALTTTEMEITPGRPASGHPVLMVLDEFAGLKRMAAIESAVAQLAGFGVKLFFVMQSLEQLKFIYKDNWETFLANAGLKIFYSIEDQFTREYVSKLAGEQELRIELRSSNESVSQSESDARGTTESETVSRSRTRGRSTSQTRGTSRSLNQSENRGVNTSRNMSESFGANESTGWSEGTSGSVNFPNGLFNFNSSQSHGRNSSVSGSRGTNSSVSRGTSEGISSGTSRGTGFSSSDGRTEGESYSVTDGTSRTAGASRTYTRGTSSTTGAGRSESVHYRPLIQPDDVGRLFARIDDKNDPAYPGLALVMITGSNPFPVRRAHYFEDPKFIGTFSRHPDHELKPAYRFEIGSCKKLFDKFAKFPDSRVLTIAEWMVRPGDVLSKPGQAMARIDRVQPDNRSIYIEAPAAGLLLSTAATPENLLPSGEYQIPDGPLFAIATYERSPNDSMCQLGEASDAIAEFWDQKEKVADKNFKRTMRSCVLMLITGIIAYLIPRALWPGLSTLDRVAIVVILAGMAAALAKRLFPALFD